MSEEILTILLSILAAVLSGGIGILTIYLKSRWKTEDLARTISIVEQVVRAAEMVGTAAGWDAEAKREQALAWATDRTGLSRDHLEAYVEAAVQRLKVGKEELTKRSGAVVPKT